MPLDRDGAKELRRQFREDVRDHVERFVQIGEESHGDSLKFWLQFNSSEEVIREFCKYLASRVS